MLNIKQRNVWAVLLSGALLAAPTVSQAFYQLNENVRPFIGVDAQKRHIQMQQVFGGNLFEKNLDQLDLYGGVQLFKYFGVQAGYQFSERADSQRDLNPGDTFLGAASLDVGDQETHLTKTHLSGWHFDLIGFWPVCKRYNVELFGSLGLIRNHLKFEDYLIADNGVLDASPESTTFDVKKTHARASLGVQVEVWKHLGIKLAGTWEDTSRFSNLKSVERPNALSRLNLGDSFIYSLGVYLKL